MSKVLEKFDFKARNRAFGGSAKHPWALWMDCNCHELSKAEDFPTAKHSTILALLRRRAKKAGLLVNSDWNKDTQILVVQAYLPATEEDHAYLAAPPVKRTKEEIAEEAAVDNGQTETTEAAQEQPADPAPVQQEEVPVEEYQHTNGGKKRKHQKV
jgi:hypothetical protein